MPSVPHLPNEIICNIISFLLPQDVDSFTSTCKLYYELSRNIRREHMGRKRLYHTIDDDDPMIIPFLVSYPDLAWYVRRLIIHNERHSFEDWKRTEDSYYKDRGPFGDWTLPYDVIINDSLDSIRTSLRISRLASAADESILLENIKRGIDAPLKVLLLSLAPKIKSLVVHPGRATMTHSPTSSFLYFFGKAIHRAAIMPLEVRPRICSELAELRVSHHRTRQPYSTCMTLGSYEIRPFFLLPSLESLFIEKHIIFSPIYDICGDYPGHDLSFRPQESSIQNLHIASIDGGFYDDFVDMVKSPKMLKLFHVRRPEQNLGIYLQALSQSHALTLEALDLGIYNPSVTDIVSLAHFRALKSLSLEVGLLQDILNAGQKKAHSSKWSNWKLDLILPVSLENLRISKRQIRHPITLFGEFLGELADFVDCKPTTHPNLRTIYLAVFRLDYDNDPDFHRLRGACNLHNVSLEGPHGNL